MAGFVWPILTGPSPFCDWEGCKAGATAGVGTAALVFSGTSMSCPPLFFLRSAVELLFGMKLALANGCAYYRLAFLLGNGPLFPIADFGSWAWSGILIFSCDDLSYLFVVLFNMAEFACAWP